MENLVINKVQANEMLNNVLNEQGIKCYTFDLYANYSNDLSSMYYDETRYHDLDYDFSVHGYCQGDAIKIKLVGSEKEFKEQSYLPTADYLTNIFYDSPINGYITVLCNGEELTNLDCNSQINFYDVSDFNEYDYWDKQYFIAKVKNTKWINEAEYFNLLIEYLNSALPTSLGYDY